MKVHGYQRRKHWQAMLLVLLLASAALTACVPLVLGGAAVGGAIMATDRRTSGAQLEDQGIETRAESRIGRELKGEKHVNVLSFNRKALMTGEVATPEMKARAEEIVRGVPNVRRVVNELAVMPAAGLSSRASDAAVTARVKGALIGDRYIDANAVKVYTERDTTYLMGLVTGEEADRIVDLVSRVKGVKKVIRIFEIVELSQVPSISRPAEPQEGGGPRRGRLARDF